MRRTDRPMRELGEGMIRAIKQQVQALIQSGAVRWSLFPVELFWIESSAWPTMCSPAGAD